MLTNLKITITKPNFNFQHLWNINENSSLTNVLYYSTGKGGGTGLHGGMINYTQDNQIDFQNIYDSNSGNSRHPFFGDLSIDLAYSDSENKSTSILYSSINNHYWEGYCQLLILK